MICPYLATVIALRGKDEFNLVIPYVRFVPHEVDVPLVVVDTRALIDGRIARLCEAGFMSAALVIPRFVQLELQRIAELPDPTQQARGRRGLEVLGELRKFEDARNAYARAIQARPDYAEAHYNLSFTLSNLGDFEGALRETKRALELDMHCFRVAEFYRHANCGRTDSKRWEAENLAALVAKLLLFVSFE